MAFRRPFWVLLCTVLIFSLPETSFAQTTATTFEELQAVVRTGDTVEVEDRAGANARGEVRSLNGNVLELATDDVRRSFFENDVARIQRLDRDSRTNGFLIGLGVGIGVGLLTPPLFCGGGFSDSECSTIVRAVFVPIGAVAGGAERIYDRSLHP